MKYFFSKSTDRDRYRTTS